MRNPWVCDAQLHAPSLGNGQSLVPGLSLADALTEMDGAGVDGAVLVPFPGTTELCFSFVEQHPARFAVMGVLDVTEGPGGYDQLEAWFNSGRIAGIRVSFFSAPARSLLETGKLEWLWARANAGEVAVMLNIPENVILLDQIAPRFPAVRFVVDHMGLTPFVVYDDFDEPLRQLLPLAKHGNVAVKASALPASVAGGYPFRALHEPVARVFNAFGPERLFWGSDLTRLSCSYADCLRLFTDGLDFLDDASRKQVLGRALAKWLRWIPWLD